MPVYIGCGQARDHTHAGIEAFMPSEPSWAISATQQAMCGVMIGAVVRLWPSGVKERGANL
jgi:hypothetical protein